MKILIVDDSRLVRIKLKAELFDRGHTVIEARDGEEALAACDSGCNRRALGTDADGIGGVLDVHAAVDAPAARKESRPNGEP